MGSILGLLNVICELATQDGVVLTGCFVKPKSNVWFSGRVSRKDYSRLWKEKRRLFTLFGVVDGKPVVCLQAVLGSWRPSGLDDEHLYCSVFPTEILVGVRGDEMPVAVSLIDASYPELHWFVHGLAVSTDGCIEDIEGRLFVAQYRPLSFSVDTLSSRLTFRRTFRAASKSDAVVFTTLYRVGFEYAEPVGIKQAVADLCSARMLMCFLADDGIAMPCEYDFATASSSVQSGVRLLDKCLWLNDAHHLVKRDYPFRISYSDIKSQFGDVWEKWSRFRRCDAPMVDLFYEVITNRTARSNRFLNLVQALEVYSCRHREAEAFHVAGKDRDNNRTGTPKPHLSHRLVDLFTYHVDVLPRELDQIATLSKCIAKTRNYFTHYNKRFDKDTMDSAYDQYNGPLHYLLLATVYKEIGIPVAVIRDALARNQDSRFATSLERLFDGPNAGEFPY